MSKKSRGGKPYPPEFRQQIVELVDAGRTPQELADEFGCHVSSIHDWVAKSKLGPSSGNAQPLNMSEREELVRLRKQLRQVQMERDILAKATAWFAQNSGESRK